MLRRTIVLFVSVILMANVLTTILIKNDTVVSASSSNQGGKVDYFFMYDVIKKLCEIVFNPRYSVDQGIYKGRSFGTTGERYTAEWLNNTIQNITTNLNVTIVKERIGNDTYGLTEFNKMRLVDNNLEILGYGLSFRNTTSGPPNATIPLNETFPFPSYTHNRGILEPYNVSTNDNYYKVEFDPWPTTHSIGNVVQYNISFSRINATENIVEGDVTHIENYRNSTQNQIEDKANLINVTDSELNNTITTLINHNASGFILIRNNITSIINWTLNLPGIAVSTQNGSLLKNLTKNGNVSVFVDENSENILHVFSYNYSTLPIGEKKIYLINQSYIATHWWDFSIKRDYITNLSTSGFIFYNSNFPYTHFHYPYTRISSNPQISYSYLNVPAFSINGSIRVNGQMRNFEQWVKQNENTNHPVRARFYINQQKNDHVVSYNVYCNVQGKDTSKYIILSGGHYEAWPGQMMADDASGVGIMMGVLKYFNDYNITPKCNLQFIFHGGHEIGGRGSISHTYNRTVTTILQSAKYLINLDELIHHFHPSTLRINITDPCLRPVLEKITQDANYANPAEQNYVSIGGEHASKFGFVDAKAYKKSSILNNNIHPPYGINIDYIEFNKNNDTNYHQSGSNNTMGDTLDVLDKDDLNRTAEIIWNTTKYLSVDPNCWFQTVTNHPKDSPSDNNLENDSIQINYTIKTTLPQDRVMIKTILYANAQDGHPLYPFRYRYQQTKNYTISSAGITDSMNISLKKNAPKGTYTLKIYLYNSTGKIDREIYEDEHEYLADYDLGYYANDSRVYNNIPLSPPNDLPTTPKIWTGPTGTLKAGTKYSFNASSTDSNGDKIEYQWNWRANKLIPSYTGWQGPFTSGINNTMTHAWNFSGPIQVRVRSRDIWHSPTFSEWSTPWNLSLTANCVIIAPSKVLVGQSEQYQAVSYDAAEPIQNYTWNFEYSPLEQMSQLVYVQNPTYMYSSECVKHQLLTVRNALSQTYTCEHTTQVLNVISNFVTNRSGAPPNKPIKFNDTSTVHSGAYLNNWTWDFNDGTPHSHNRNVTHSYNTAGVYNVTLTAKDNQGHTNTYGQIVHIEMKAPDVLESTYSPYFLVTGSNINIYVDFFDNESTVNSVKVSITTPDSTTGNYTMIPSNTSGYDYEYTYSDTWQPGQYNYSIWVTDHANNTNSSTGYRFIVSDALPVNGATGLITNPTLTVHINDPNKEWANVSFYQYFSDHYIIDSENDWKQGTFTSTRTDGSGNLILANESTLYGTGANGDYTVTSTITLTGNKSYRNLTINSGKTLNTAGYILKVSGKLLNYGTITDSSTGGSGGSGGAGGGGQDFKQNSGGPKYAQAGSTGTNGSSGSKPASGHGGRGGAGGGGGGGSWHNLSGNDADGGNGGTGGTGGKGGGFVSIFAFKLDNQGVIHANGSVGINGANGIAGGHKDFTYLLGSHDISGGGGGGAGGGNGGSGGTVNITYGVLLNQGKIYASAGAKGNKGNGGSGQYNTYGVSIGAFGNGATGGSGGGAGAGGAGGKGRYTQGTSDSGTNGNDGSPGSTAGNVIKKCDRYTTSGNYYRIIDAGSTVEWARSVITQTTPVGTSVTVTYGSNATGSWNYYENITLLPTCRWLKIRVNLSTNNITATPSVDKISISTRSLLHTDTNVPDGTNATYQWTGRSLNTWYYWQVRIFNSVGSAYGPVWSFKTVTS